MNRLFSQGHWLFPEKLIPKLEQISGTKIFFE
jgi:hypothetical protein